MTASNENTPGTQGQRWAQLAARSQAGDKRAYNQLLSEIFPYVRNVLAGQLAQPNWAEDVAQEVLISVHKSLKTYSPDRPFTPWLMAIVNFRKTDFLRRHYGGRRNRQTGLDDPTFVGLHVTNPDHAGEYRDVERALAALPDKQRRVFSLMRIGGYSAQEVAEKMKMSVSAVKVSVHRTHKKLKDELE